VSLASALLEFTHNLVTGVAVVGRSYVAAKVDDDGLVGGQLDGGVQAVAGVAVGAVVGCGVVGRSGARGAQVCECAGRANVEPCAPVRGVVPSVVEFDLPSLSPR